MKRKQKRLNKMFSLIGQAVMYLIFNTSCTALLIFGLTHITV